MFESTLERMKNDGIPARVDRSYLGTASGSARAQLTGAFKSLGLIDDELRPTPTLRELAEDSDGRPVIMRALLERHYAPIVALDPQATPQMLEEAFREHYGIQGSTVRKAVSFYLAAARLAEIPVSPLFAAPRASSATGTRRRRVKKTEPEPAARPVVDPMDTLRTKYVETLLDKFAQSNGEVDADLADRIERLVGFDAPTRSES